LTDSAELWGNADFTHRLGELSWMAALPVGLHLNERSTGHPARDWLTAWAPRFMPGEKLNVLVLGCGDGWLERALAQHPWIAHIDACDFAADAVARARALAPPKIDYRVLEGALRDDLEPRAPRMAAVLEPLRLIIDNYPEGLVEECTAPLHPQRPELGRRSFPIARELWIERDDFAQHPPKGYFRLFPGNKVRLRHGYVIECKGAETNAAGEVIAVHAEYFPDSKSGTEGANAYKVKGNIHWVSVRHALPVEVRLYDRLFTDQQPDSGSKNFLEFLNPDSKRTVTAYVEPGVGDGPHQVQPDDRLQFERHGYFVADRVDSRPGKPVFNRIVTLRDVWQTTR